MVIIQSVKQCRNGGDVFYEIVLCVTKRKFLFFKKSTEILIRGNHGEYFALPNYQRLDPWLGKWIQIRIKQYYDENESLRSPRECKELSPQSS